MKCNEVVIMPLCGTNKRKMKTSQKKQQKKDKRMYSKNVNIAMIQYNTICNRMMKTH